MSKITFSFHAKARETAKKALEKLILVASSSSVLFQVVMKEVDDRLFVAIGSFMMTFVMYGIIVFIECFKDETVTAPKKTGVNRSTDDTS